MNRAQQLPLQISVDDSARLRLDCELADAYAREQHERVLELAEENDQLEDALEAAEARVLELERQLLAAETMARTWQAQADLWRRLDLATPHHALSKDVLLSLLVLAHPDKWSQGQPATELAHELSVVVNQLRERGQA